MSWKEVDINNEVYTYEYFLTEDVCRLCWCRNGVEEITLRTSEDDKTNVNIAEIIHVYLGVDLSINPRPTKICFSCWNEVKNFSEFRRFCLATQSKLYDKLQVCSQKQIKLNLNIVDTKSSKDYINADNEFSDLELSAIDTLFEDINNETDKVESLSLPKSSKKIKKTKSDTYCSLCKTDLGSIDMLTQHNADIHSYENGLHKCFGCDRPFKNRQGCLRHEVEFCKALINGYKCNICGKFLQKRVLMEIHLRAHREDSIDMPLELFQCKKCVKQFITMKLLNEHMKDHKTDTKNWVCDTCGRVFMRRDYLYKHKLMHEGLKQHVCPHCDFRTIQKSSLTVHIRKHTGERPYPCSLCPQRCVNSSNLREHMKRHLGVKTFQCEICDKKFGYKISLREHISSIHERSEVHSCDECGATYSRLRGLRRHLSTKHEKSKTKPK